MSCRMKSAGIIDGRWRQSSWTVVQAQFSQTAFTPLEAVSRSNKRRRWTTSNNRDRASVKMSYRMALLLLYTDIFCKAAAGYLTGTYRSLARLIDTAIQCANGRESARPQSGARFFTRYITQVCMCISFFLLLIEFLSCQLGQVAETTGNVG